MGVDWKDVIFFVAVIRFVLGREGERDGEEAVVGKK